MDMNELINAGVSFQMQNSDAEFGADGELIGYTEVARREPEFDLDEDSVGDHRNRYFLSSEGVTDTTELSQPYWDAVAEAHLAEMVAAELLAMPRKNDLSDNFGAMEFWQAQRAVRFDRLYRMAQRLRRDKRIMKLAELKAGVRTRYAASVRLIVTRQRNEWWLLYLTKEQAAQIAAV